MTRPGRPARGKARFQRRRRPPAKEASRPANRPPPPSSAPPRPANRRPWASKRPSSPSRRPSSPSRRPSSPSRRRRLRRSDGTPGEATIEDGDPKVVDGNAESRGRRPGSPSRRGAVTRRRTGCQSRRAAVTDGERRSQAGGGRRRARQSGATGPSRTCRARERNALSVEAKLRVGERNVTSVEAASSATHRLSGSSKERRGRRTIVMSVEGPFLDVEGTGNPGERTAPPANGDDAPARRRASRLEGKGVSVEAPRSPVNETAIRVDGRAIGSTGARFGSTERQSRRGGGAGGEREVEVGERAALGDERACRARGSERTVGDALEHEARRQNKHRTAGQRAGRRWSTTARTARRFSRCGS